MAKVGKLSSPFEQSFMFHMIRDFFLLLLLVATVEMGIRYALLRYDFAIKEQARVDQAAQQLANPTASPINDWVLYDEAELPENKHSNAF